jgi:hypothetical protein
MARRYKRDKRGRFAGGGAIAAVTRSTSMGSHARRAATTVKAEKAGAKTRAQRDSRAAASSYGPSFGGVRVRAVMPSVANRSQRDAAAGRKKTKTMERERRSLLRRGSMRGGG